MKKLVRSTSAVVGFVMLVMTIVAFLIDYREGGGILTMESLWMILGSGCLASIILAVGTSGRSNEDDD